MLEAGGNGETDVGEADGAFDGEPESGSMDGPVVGGYKIGAALGFCVVAP